jgi:hypothetical protein
MTSIARKLLQRLLQDQRIGKPHWHVQIPYLRQTH